jgi:hypothetical protein
LGFGGGMETKMTTEQVKRTNQALAETHGMLAKELSYQPKHQKQGRILQLRAHCEVLMGMLKTGTHSFN